MTKFKVGKYYIFKGDDFDLKDFRIFFRKWLDGKPRKCKDCVQNSWAVFEGINYGFLPYSKILHCFEEYNIIKQEELVL